MPIVVPIAVCDVSFVAQLEISVALVWTPMVCPVEHAVVVDHFHEIYFAVGGPAGFCLGHQPMRWPDAVASCW